VIKPARHVFAFNETARDRWVEANARRVAPGSRVLDVGAGTCRYRRLFNHCEYKSHDFARYQGPEHQYNDLDFISDITDIPVPARSFDWIICTEVLEHVPRPDLALREFARILRPGGGMLLTAPLGSGIHMAPYHFYGGFTPYWYEHFLPEYGFKIEEVLPNGGFFKHYGQESQRFLSMMRPHSLVGRLVAWPMKMVLGIWFRLAMPLIGHVLDPLDRDRDFTVGYFVRAKRHP
jgi:ubiquinone/menaquinone biosynthesis C-methylase UbiE